MCFSSYSTSSTFSPERNVLSITLPRRMCFSFVRTKAPPLPGLTCWKSTMAYGCPSKTMRRPFLNSAVDTCMGLLASPSQARTQRGFQPLARLDVVGRPPHHAREHQRCLVGQPLLQAHGAEAERGERLVGQDPRQPGAVAGRARVGAQQRQQRLRLAIAGIETDSLLEVPDRDVQAARPAVDLGGQTVTLYVFRAGLQNRAQLGQGRLELSLGQQRLGEDQARGRVVRPAAPPGATAGGGVAGAARVSL